MGMGHVMEEVTNWAGYEGIDDRNGDRDGNGMATWGAKVMAKSGLAWMRNGSWLMQAWRGSAQMEDRGECGIGPCCQEVGQGAGQDRVQGCSAGTSDEQGLSAWGRELFQGQKLWRRFGPCSAPAGLWRSPSCELYRSHSAAGPAHMICRWVPQALRLWL